MYAFGSCNRGKDCDFAHRTPSAAEIKEYGFYKNDPTKGGKDGKGKTKGKCTPFFDSGKCRFGDKCIFSHGDKDKDKAKAKSKSKAKAKGKGKTRARSAPAVEGDWDEEDEDAAGDDGYYEEE